MVPEYEAFGAKGRKQSYAWSVPAGVFDDAEDVFDGLFHLFREQKKVVVSVHELLEDRIPNGSYLAIFSEPPPFLGKEIVIKEVKHLITVESPNKCRICKARDHPMWLCPNQGRTAIGVERVVGELGQNASTRNSLRPQGGRGVVDSLPNMDIDLNLGPE